MSEWTSKIVDRIFCLLFALLFLQFPLFMEQYTTRLSGHVDELHFQVGKIEKVAKASNKSLHQYIEKFLESKESDFSKQGSLMKEMVERKAYLANALESMHSANPLTRPFIFLFKSDWEIVQNSLASYQPGLAITFESAIYGVVGLFIGYYFYLLLSSFASRIYEGFRRAKMRESAKAKNSESMD